MITEGKDDFKKKSQWKAIVLEAKNPSPKITQKRVGFFFPLQPEPYIYINSSNYIPYSFCPPFPIFNPFWFIKIGISTSAQSRREGFSSTLSVDAHKMQYATAET